MQIDHVNIHCHDHEAVRDFLIALLGLKVGWRPRFPVHGYWLYEADDDSAPARNADPEASYPDGARAVIHTWPRVSPPGLGWVDHIAFRPDEPVATIRARLQQLGRPFREQTLVDTEVTQFFVTGPDDVKIELQVR
jgi:catechol 2,3-dioxygenase-like lactoylglutathione lyase family enzyme